MEKSLQNLEHRFIKPADNLVEVVWGGFHIEKMKGLTPSGKKIGESWECSAHPQHPSKIITEDGFELPLPNLLSVKSREILGREIATEFGNNLPLLVKFIDAREDLSVQVHPSDEKAKELGEKDSGKNEFWLILEAEKDSVLYLGFKEDVDKREFERALSSSDINIAQQYLNAFPVKKGDYFFNPAGTAHAIGRGIVLAEIQQSSGLTYRLWDWNRLPPRPLHIKKALEALDFTKRTKGDFQKVPHRLNQNEERLIDSLYFSVDRITLNSGDEISLDTKGGFQILSCLEGEIELQSQHSSERLFRGQSLLVPASINRYKIATNEWATLLKSFLAHLRRRN